MTPRDILNKEFKRLNITKKFEAQFNLYRFAKQTRMIESDNRNDVSPTNTTAKGYYQFTDGALETAYNRTQRYYFNPIQRKPVIELTKDEQTSIFLANLFQQTGTDELLMLIAAKGGSTHSAITAKKDLYARYHHTKPTDGTLQRMLKFYV